MIYLRMAVGIIAVLAGICPLHGESTPTPPANEGTRLTWEDCVRLAVRENPDLQSSREAVLNSDAVHRGAYSALYPQISASFSDTRSYDGPGLYSPRNYATAYSEQISLSQTIFNGFATKGNIDQSRAELNLAFANMNAEKATISFNLKSAFAQLVYAQKLITISRDVIDIREKSARLVKLLYEGGSEDKGAMLLSNANLDEATVALDQATRTCLLSGIQLAVAIGKDLPQPILAEGELKTSPLPPTPDYRKLAIQTPAFFQKRAQVDAAAAGITLATSDWYPTITASASASRTDVHWPLKDKSWSAGFTVSYPIFEGGRTYFNVKAADASFRESLANLRSGVDQASLTLAQTYKSMVDSQENARIQQELLEATALRYKIAEASYRNGRTSFQDFNSITDNFVSQQQSCLASQRDAVIAEASWEQARGLGAIP
jgi:outer membrane protein TolC